jgi:hypothetical protein
MTYIIVIGIYRGYRIQRLNEPIQRLRAIYNA